MFPIHMTIVIKYKRTKNFYNLPLQSNNGVLKKKFGRVYLPYVGLNFLFFSLNRYKTMCFINVSNNFTNFRDFIH